MKKSPTVSVLMPAYNAEKYIAEAIESILSQTYTDFEFIIADDCSTDKTSQIIEKYQQRDQRIHLLKNQINLGIAKTRNILLRQSQGTYIAWLDSDDTALEKRLEKQVSCLEEHKDIALVGSNLNIINENSEVIATRKYPTSPALIHKCILRYCPIAQPSVLVRSNIIKYLKYDENLEICEDYDLWLKINSKYKIMNLNEALINYRISTTQSKSIKLKKTIINTLLIKKKWLFSMKYFRFSALLRYLLELGLLIFPNKVITFIFKVSTYKSVKPNL